MFEVKDFIKFYACVIKRLDCYLLGGIMSFVWKDEPGDVSSRTVALCRRCGRKRLLEDSVCQTCGYHNKLSADELMIELGAILSDCKDVTEPRMQRSMGGYHDYHEGYGR